MDEKPKRRFQFKLSTVLILTAIAACAMACWPWWYEVELPPPELSEESKAAGWRISIYAVQTTTEVNPRLAWPCFAFGIFCLWKGARDVVEKWRAKTPTHS